MSFSRYDTDEKGPWALLPERSIPFRIFLVRDADKLKHGGDPAIGIPRLVEWARRLADVDAQRPEYLNALERKRKPKRQPSNVADLDWLIYLCDEENYRWGPEILAHCETMELKRVNASDSPNSPLP